MDTEHETNQSSTDTTDKILIKPVESLQTKKTDEDAVDEVAGPAAETEAEPAVEPETDSAAEQETERADAPEAETETEVEAETASTAAAEATAADACANEDENLHVSEGESADFSPSAHEYKHEHKHAHMQTHMQAPDFVPADTTFSTLSKGSFKNLAEQTKEKTHKKHHFKMHPIKSIFVIIGVVLLVGAGTFAGYACYLESHYSRIPDNKMLKVEPAQKQEQDQPKQLNYGSDYTICTYNIGFGAYTPSYTFFMDKGEMLDGTKHQGAYGKARSLEAVTEATKGAIDAVATAVDGNAPDFMMFQEIDVNSDRSFHVDQTACVRAAFANYESSYASDFHSGFLAYPLHDMHGSVQSGIMTLSRVDMTSSVRRSYPVSTAFPDKFFDLDRCFEVTRYRLPDKHELVLINSHMSAYDEGGVFRAQQVKMLTKFMKQEYAKGNYVIAGGDWNCALGNSIGIYPTQQKRPEWIQELKESDIPQGFSYVAADNIGEVPTCRADDIPYEKGVTYTATVDGFIASDNVSASAHHIDTGFAASDHNPVLLRFSLKPAAQ